MYSHLPNTCAMFPVQHSTEASLFVLHLPATSANKLIPQRGHLHLRCGAFSCGCRAAQRSDPLLLWQSIMCTHLLYFPTRSLPLLSHSPWSTYLLLLFRHASTARCEPSRLLPPQVPLSPRWRIGFLLRLQWRARVLWFLLLTLPCSCGSAFPLPFCVCLFFFSGHLHHPPWLASFYCHRSHVTGGPRMNLIRNSNPLSHSFLQCH